MSSMSCTVIFEVARMRKGRLAPNREVDPLCGRNRKLAAQRSDGADQFLKRGEGGSVFRRLALGITLGYAAAMSASLLSVEGISGSFW